MGPLIGSRQEILCEGPSKTNKERLSGRTSQNKIVIFDGDAERMTGEIFEVDIEDFEPGFTLYGTAVCELIWGLKLAVLWALPGGEVSVGSPRMSGGPHPYQELSLSTAGVVLGVVLIGFYGFMLAKSELCREWTNKLARHYQAGVYAMAIGMVWFWLLIAPGFSRRAFRFSASWSMDLGEFSGLKPYLQIGVPLACAGMIFYVREFLFVRGAGALFADGGGSASLCGFFGASGESIAHSDRGLCDDH